MGLSARTDDNTGLPIGEGYVASSTSAGNLVVFATPASRDQYVMQNPAQFYKAAPGNNAPDGDYSQGVQSPGLP